MTKLMMDAMKKLSQLPAGRQNELAQMLIDVAASDLSPYQLTAKERAAVQKGIEQAERGEFATDEEVALVWKRFGL